MSDTAAEDEAITEAIMTALASTDTTISAAIISANTADTAAISDTDISVAITAIDPTALTALANTAAITSILVNIRANVHELEPAARFPIILDNDVAASTLTSNLIPADSNIGPDIFVAIIIPDADNTPDTLLRTILVCVNDSHHDVNSGGVQLYISAAYSDTMLLCILDPVCASNLASIDSRSSNPHSTRLMHPRSAIPQHIFNR